MRVLVRTSSSSPGWTAWQGSGARFPVNPIEGPGARHARRRAQSGCPDRALTRVASLCWRPDRSSWWSARAPGTIPSTWRRPLGAASTSRTAPERTRWRCGVGLRADSSARPAHSRQRDLAPRRQWNKAEFSKARGLYGRTLGLLGVGSIGSRMIPRAKAFGMRVVAWSRGLGAERAEAFALSGEIRPRSRRGGRYRERASCAGAGNAPTVRRRLFCGMKKGACFINTARGEIVDEEALKALFGIRAFAPVWMSSPKSRPAGRASSQAGSHSRRPSTALTTIGASTEEAQEPLRRRPYGLCAYSRRPASRRMFVNLARKTPATCALVVRHLDRPGVLASVLDAISAARSTSRRWRMLVFGRRRRRRLPG